VGRRLYLDDLLNDQPENTRSSARTTAVASAGGVGRRSHVCVAHHFRRLRLRCDKRADIHEVFLSLGCVLIWQSLQRAG
jgi:hypothetical protein